MKSLFNTLSLPTRVLLIMVLVLAACLLQLAGVLPGAPGGVETFVMAMPAAVAPFPVTPELQAVAIAYRNEKMIADDVLPRVPVGLQNFKYNSYPKAEAFTVPETKVARKGAPNTVEFTATEVDSSTVDHGLDDEVPHADIENAKNQPGMPDPLMRATEGTTELIVLAREVRVAALVFDAAQYAAANKVQLAGNDQWNVDHANSNPIDDIMTGLDACIMRPNVLVIGRAAFTKLAMHKMIVKATYGDGTDAGIATREAIKRLFELDDVLVGEGWVNTAKKGQAANLVRVWGKHAALIHRNKNADAQRGITYGFTAQWGARVAGSEYDGKIGLRGGQRVRVGESVKELIMANDLGYFIQDAVA